MKFEKGKSALEGNLGGDGLWCGAEGEKRKSLAVWQRDVYERKCLFVEHSLPYRQKTFFFLEIKMSNSSVVYIDTSARSIQVYAGNLTEVAYGDQGKKGFVLRLGAEIGNLGSFSENYRFSVPVVISGKGYQARSSNGFVSVSDSRFGSEQYFLMVGKMPIGGKLQVLGHPEKIFILSPGTCVSSIATHKNSNPQTSEAAGIGLSIRAEVHKSLVISEGQSDYIQGWEFVPPDPDAAEELWQIDFSPEHRAEKFASEKLVRSCFNFNRRFMPAMEKESDLAWLLGFYDPRNYEEWKKFLTLTEVLPPTGEEKNPSPSNSADEEEFVEVE